MRASAPRTSLLFPGAPKAGAEPGQTTACMAGGAELLCGIQPPASRNTLCAQGAPSIKEIQKQFCFSSS